MADGPDRGLTLIEPLADALDGYLPFHSARADLLRRLDRRTEATEAYDRAVALATNTAQRRYLDRRLAEIELTAP